MSKNIRIIYLYLVCLISLFMIIGGFVATVNSFAEYFFPTNYYSSYSYYDSSDDIARLKIQKENDKIANLKDAVTSIALLVVATPVFAYHWKKIEKDKKELEG